MEGERGVELLIHNMGCEVSSGGNKIFVGLYSDEGCINLWIYKKPEFYTITE